MVDERDPSQPGAFLEAIDGLRDDFREDIGHLRDDVREDNQRLEDRLMAVIADLRAEARSSIEAHAKQHLEAAIDTESELEKIRTFMRNWELSKAYRDGALGVFRFAVEQVSRHARPIATVLLAAAGFIGLVSGSIRLDVVLR